MKSRLNLISASVTTAIEDAGIDKMDKSGKNEMHVLRRDISGPPYSDTLFATDVSQWLAASFGASSQKFKMTQTLMQLGDTWEISSCIFRGNDPIDILMQKCKSAWDFASLGRMDQDICITKVDAEEVADPVSQESKADSVAIDDLFDFEPASFVSQIGHSAVQNPWISHSIVFGVGCVLPTILKAIIKKMAPRRVRRRIMRPRMLSLNQEEENMKYVMMTDDV